MKTLPLILKSFVRSAVDSCILPGTMAGSEILWIYTQQWKKEITTCCLAIFYLAMIQIEIPHQLRVIFQQPTNRAENVQ